MKKSTIITIARFVKGFLGTAGITILIADYKWTGIAACVLAALADQTIIALGKQPKAVPTQPADDTTV